MSLNVGDKAPNFKSVNQKGEDIELKNTLGRKLFYISILGITHQVVQLRL